MIASATVLGLGGCVLNYYFLRRAQNLKDRLDPEEIKEKYSQEELVAMGDKAPTFRYTL
jgi:hypothetical protein